MPSYVTPKKGVAFICYVKLPSAAGSGFQVSPTLASGDVKVEIDGGASANITTLPTVTPSGGTSVKVSLSTSEMNGDNIMVTFKDQTSPAEWLETSILIQTSARQVDDLAYPATSGRSIDVDASGRTLLQPTQTGVTIPTVTTLTNAPSDSSGVTTLLSRVPSGLFTGITSLAQWLGLIAGKQTGNSTARTEIRATGAGSGTFDETTDSQEAIRDNMGTAQTGDSYARLGAPAGASVSADIAATRARQSTTATVTGTVVSDAGNSATQIKTDLTQTTDDHFKDCLVKITSGTLAEQLKRCTGYNGTTKILSFSSGFTGTPANGVTFEIVND